MKDLKRVTILNNTVWILIFIAFVSSAQAQSCRDVLNSCSKVDDFFNYKTMARTYKLNPTQKLKIFQIFYGSKGYNINICNRDTTNKFHIRLLDNSSKIIFWDNSKDDYSNNISISFGSTQRILIEVSAVDPKKMTLGNNCLGIEIRYHKEKVIKDSSTEEPDNPFF